MQNLRKEGSKTHQEERTAKIPKKEALKCTKTTKKLQNENGTIRIKGRAGREA